MHHPSPSFKWNDRAVFAILLAGLVDVFLDVVAIFVASNTLRLLIVICKRQDRGDMAAPLEPWVRKGSSATLWPTWQSYFWLSTSPVPEEVFLHDGLSCISCVAAGDIWPSLRIGRVFGFFPCPEASRDMTRYLEIYPRCGTNQMLACRRSMAQVWYGMQQSSCCQIRTK